MGDPPGIPAPPPRTNGTPLTEYGRRAPGELAELLERHPDKARDRLGLGKSRKAMTPYRLSVARFGDGVALHFVGEKSELSIELTAELARELLRQVYLCFQPKQADQDSVFRIVNDKHGISDPMPWSSVRSCLEALRGTDRKPFFHVFKEERGPASGEQRDPWQQRTVTVPAVGLEEAVKLVEVPW